MNRQSRQPSGASKRAQVRVKTATISRSQARLAGMYILLSAFTLSLLSALSKLSHL
ncbi:MAG TPA: hypothetical protein PKZ32_14025 [Candidatus Melainabacteria bacterium]|nr:hypothetical protein [Candidatus Melainabacteria bacterium]